MAGFADRFRIHFTEFQFAAIFGFIPLISSLLDLNADNMTGFLYALGYSMLGLLPLIILAGLAHDIEMKIEGKP
jgi:hypothetical protein